jgi:hypothetical protein
MSFGLSGANSDALFGFDAPGRVPSKCFTLLGALLISANASLGQLTWEQTDDSAFSASITTLRESGW